MPDIKHGALVGGVVKLETLDPYLKQVTVKSKDNVGIWFTVNGVDPTVNGEDVYWTNGVTVVPLSSSPFTTPVKLLAAIACTYEVKGEDVV